MNNISKEDIKKFESEGDFLNPPFAWRGAITPDLFAETVLLAYSSYMDSDKKIKIVMDYKMAVYLVERLNEKYAPLYLSLNMVDGLIQELSNNFQNLSIKNCIYNCYGHEIEIAFYHNTNDQIFIIESDSKKLVSHFYIFS